VSKSGNLFADMPARSPGETTDPILSTDAVRIERIVSHAHASPPGFWYDQAWPEWVMVVAGSAGVLFEGEREPVALRAGDHLTIAAHRRHRVEWTDADRATVWLAVHYRCGPG
jgi:cupin 2 domain-containing protein